ncbi:MAG: MarR family winged helix-turn-helix transcriptional regulator [Aquabacterium sp.]|uniref:MarR family winged helix-turn-helix transcriptional regulator n=1 Tax=Aquabacterium sp. TaxID=1872578 RepID=UPI003BC694BA
MSSRPRLIFLLNSAQRHLQQWMAAQQELATPAAVPAASPAQSGVLFTLDKSDGVTMGELAKALDLAPSAVSGLIQRMEALQWVSRRPCTLDARTQRVWLLDAGRTQLPALRSALARINRQLTDGFTDDELQTVARWLQHVQHLHTQDTP